MQLIINIPDALRQRLEDALVARFSGLGLPPAQLARHVCVDQLKMILREREIELAKRAAGETKAAEIEAELSGIS